MPEARIAGTPARMTRGIPGDHATGRPVSTYTQAAHWGELVQGPVRHRGRLITALITLPRRDLTSTASFTPSPGELTITPSWCIKAGRAARLVLGMAGQGSSGGDLRIRTDIPPGCGSGSTTADVTATIRAVAKAVGLRLTPRQIQRLDWEIEGAADPLALVATGRAVVYGSRTGEIVRWLPRPLPAMQCLGFNTRPGETVLTDELAARTRYETAEEDAFLSILRRATAAIESGSLAVLARAATDSARLNQHRLPTTHFDSLIGMITRSGGLGLAVSHSGTVGAAIFDPGLADLESRIAGLSDGLRSLGCGEVKSFTAGSCSTPDPAPLRR